jgi:cell division protein FtsB
MKQTSFKSPAILKSSKSFSYFLIFVLVFALIFLGRAFSQRIKLEKEAVNLEEKIAKIKLENENLSDETKKMATEYFLEKQARLKFGLKKPDEKIIVIVDPKNLGEKLDQENVLENKLNNFKIWWNYFTKTNLKK